MTHSFEVHEAEKYGIQKAILLYNLRFWLTKNQANSKHIYEQFYWTYNSAAAFAKLFPYMNPGSIKNWLLELEFKDMAIRSGNFSSDKMNRTKWYTIPDEFQCVTNPLSDKPFTENPSTENPHCIAPTVQSIALPVPTIAPTVQCLYDTDINTDSKQHIKNNGGFEEIFEQQEEYIPPPTPNTILSEMTSHWLKLNPQYKKIATPKFDNPAIRQIAETITHNKMFHLDPEMAMKKWRAFCSVVLTNDFYCQKPLKTICNNIQTFLQDIEKAEKGHYTPPPSKNNSVQMQFIPQKVVLDGKKGYFINNGAPIRL